MNKITENGYIIAVSTGDFGEQITETEYNEILSIIQTAPIAPEGYAYMLRADNLEWELVKNENIDDDIYEENVYEEDFIDALSELGVLSSD